MRQLKEDLVVVEGQTASQFTARRLVEVRPSFLEDFFGAGRCLVPIPRSGLLKPNGLWPGMQLASAIADVLPDLTVTQYLRRALAVPKASLAASDERPSVERHRASLDVTESVHILANVTLVDDVITRGAQAMGAALAIWNVRPDVSIRVFAAIRTISDEDEFSAVLAPVTGKVSWHNDRICRRP